jgi:hypothetical protein
MQNKIEGVPDGWEIVRIGYPGVGEHIIEQSGGTLQVVKALDYPASNYVIVRKIKTYRPATHLDIGKEVLLDGETWIVYSVVYEYGCMVTVRLKKNLCEESVLKAFLSECEIETTNESES